MLTIIGCGNPTRGDDGVGPFVAQRLRASAAHGRADVRAFDAGTDGMAVMFAARGSDALIIVDAVTGGAPPGAIYDVPGELVARDYAPTLTLHDFRWTHALAAGRRIFGAAFPATVSVVLIEAETTAFGLVLSAAVARAAETVVARLEARIAAYREPVPA